MNTDTAPRNPGPRTFDESIPTLEQKSAVTELAAESNFTEMLNAFPHLKRLAGRS